MVSLDDGRTWPISRVIDDGSAANLGLVVLPGGRVLYERDNYWRLSFQRVDLATVLNLENEITGRSKRKNDSQGND